MPNNDLNTGCTFLLPRILKSELVEQIEFLFIKREHICFEIKRFLGKDGIQSEFVYEQVGMKLKYEIKEMNNVRVLSYSTHLTENQYISCL